MTKEEYAEYRDTDYWLERSAVIQARDRMCRLCCSKSSLQVHHITYDRCPFDELDSDLITVCGRCHLAIHGLIVEGMTLEEDKQRRLVASNDERWEWHKYYEDASIWYAVPQVCDLSNEEIMEYVETTLSFYV